MKLIGLKFQGVGPYKGEFSIDFAALTRSHMFLIDGETGAGKTTILDCITFALYGNISGNTEGRNGAGDKQRLRSRFLDGTAEKTYVDLIFEEGGRYYKVYRSPEYPRAKARSEGFTSEKSKANMMRIAGDYEAEFRSLIDEVPQNAENGREAERYYAFFDMPAHAEAITSKVSEVSVEVTGLLGLNRSQFSKTIMLAQGQFAEFLRMRPEQRTELVKDLFCAQEYEDIQNQLNVMRQQYGRRVDEQRHDLAAAIRDNQANAGRIREALNAYRDIDGGSSDLTAASDAAQPEAMPFGDDARWGLNEVGDIDEPAYSADQIVARLDGTLESVRNDAQTLVTKAETQFAEADSAWRESQRRNDTANAVRKAQGDLRSAQVRMEELNALEQENKRDEQRVEQAVQANPIMDLARDRKRQDELIASNVRDRERLQAELDQYESLDSLNRDHAQALQAAGVAQAAEREMEIAQTHGKLVGQMQQAQHALQKAETAWRQCQGKLEHAQWAIGQFPEESRLEQQLDEIATRLGTQGQLTETVNRARELLEHAQRHETLLPERDRAEATVKALERSHKDAVAAYERAQRQLYAAGAARYVQELHDGEPCPVCGSREHPHPARQPEQTPTKAGIDALKVQAERRAGELGEARIALAELRQNIEAEHEASGGCDVLEAENRLAEAKRALQKLEPLRDEYGKLKRSREQRRAFKNELDRAKQDCVAVQAQCTAARQALEQAAERAEGITAQSVEQERERAERRLAEAQRQERRAQQIEQKLKERNAIEMRITELTAHNETLNQQRGTIARALREKLASSAFADLDAACHAALDERSIQQLKQRIDSYKRNHAAAQGELERADDELTRQRHAWKAIGGQYSIERTAEALEASRLRRDEAMRLQSTAATLDAERRRYASQLRVMASDWRQAMVSYAPIRTMALLAMGDRNSPAVHKVSLITYAVTERFRDVLDRANELLKDIRGGIYELRLGDHEGRAGGKTGLPIEVLDRRTDIATEPSTLSGGETFFVSLALALALADVIQAENGGVSMDTLFIDEGFGTLSDEFLDDVMDVLRGIARGRDIGIISHVGRLKGQIAERITVERVSENAESRLSVTI